MTLQPSSLTRFLCLEGTFSVRIKSGRPGTDPHFFAKVEGGGLQWANFDDGGDLTNNQGVALAIEARFDESKACPFLPKGKGSLNIIGAIFGGPGMPPTNQEAKALRELGHIIAVLQSRRQQVCVIATPNYSPEQYGMAAGRFIPIAIYTQDRSQAIWIHPGAVAEGLFPQDAFPSTQKVRTLTDGPRQGAATASLLPAWYEAAASSLIPAGVRGADLVRAATKNHANLLLTAGAVETLEEGIQKARVELRTAATAAGLTMPGLEDEPVPEPAKAEAKPAAKKPAPKATPSMGANSDATRALLAPPKGKKR